MRHAATSQPSCDALLRGRRGGGWFRCWLSPRVGRAQWQDSAPVSFLCVRPAASARHVHLGHSGPRCGWHGLMHDASCGILSACTVLLLIECPLVLFGSQSSWVNAGLLQLLVVATRANKQWHFPILVQTAGCFEDAGQQNNHICCLHCLVGSLGWHQPPAAVS